MTAGTVLKLLVDLGAACRDYQDAVTKLVPSWHIGTRDAGCAYEFMVDLASRLRGRVQLTTDGHGAYLSKLTHYPPLRPRPRPAHPDARPAPLGPLPAPEYHWCNGPAGTGIAW